MLNEKIHIAKGFQTSVNIAYDLHNDQKVKSFIPTMASLDVIEDVLLSTSLNGGQKSKILIGAYGRGKSHIILVLMSLLFKKDVALFDMILIKMKKYNPKLYELALDYLKSNKKLLPIIISGSSSSLTQSFLNALQQALKAEAFEDLMPETNFKAAINTIELWRQNYPDTYNKFIKALSRPVVNFLLELKEYDINAYEHFEMLYPTLTSGSTFNPFVGFDVVELYEKVVEKLADKGFNGVYIVYDEFSKYLESSISNATISDIKLLQDFSEKCNRSIGNKQMHLMLISHKDISNYIDNNLPKEKVDGWRGVSGRFQHINLHNNFSQMYEVISEVIIKDNDFWEEFCEMSSNRFEDLSKRIISNGMLDKNDTEIINLAVKGCYPLHPISTFILPRLSEKVAQNERTLFTFLSSDNKYTLAEFIKTAKGDFPLLTPDYLYDYFEPLLRKEPYTSEIHKIYKLTSNVLHKVKKNSLGSKIIKTISLVYIVEQFEKLPPIYNVLVDAFQDSVEDIKEISKALNDLIEKDCIIYLKRSNNYLKLKETSGIDIPGEIQKYVELNKNTLSTKKILNKSVFDSYMYPTMYNDEHDIIRYFDLIFIDSEEFLETENFDRKIQGNYADGIIYAIIPKSKEDIAILKQSIINGRCNHNRIVCIVTNAYIDIKKIAYEYSAVIYLKSLIVDDELLSDEYQIYIDDLEEVIANYIFSYARPENHGAEYFYMEQKRNLFRKSQLSELLSYICEISFPFTPIINNESINKNLLPTVAVNSRTKLITGLLQNDLDSNLGLTGSGQDVSIMRSTLIQTGILQNDGEIPLINLAPQDANMRNMLTHIQNFFTGAIVEIGRNFQELYDLLTLPEYQIGLKRGVIPIYIAVVLHEHKNNLVIKNKDAEVKITADLLNSINESPNDYSVIIENWNIEKTQYMLGLEKTFKEYVIEKEKTYNSFSYIVLAMNRWYMSLPKYAKEMKFIYCGQQSKTPNKSVEKEHLKFINSLKQIDNNSREYLFEKIFKIFGFNDFNITIIDNIALTKKNYDASRNNLINVLIEDVKAIFGAKNLKKESLTSTIKDWYETLNSNTTSHIFSNNENRIVELMGNISNDESTFMESLCKAVTSLRIDDWNSKTIELFINDLTKLKLSVENFNDNLNKKNTKNSNVYKLVFVKKDGTETVKTFDKMEYSSRAKLLLNGINNAIDEMGQSISEQEKRQVLMELLEKMC